MTGLVCDVLIAVLPMTQPTYTTRTAYAVVKTRFAFISKDVANSILFYNTQEEADAYAEKMLTEDRYTCLLHTVAVIPFDVSGYNSDEVCFFPHAWGVTARVGVLPKNGSFDFSTNDQDKK